MKRKIVLIILAIGVIAATGGWYYVFEYSKTHHRDVESENAINITASQLVKDYETDEAKANSRYLNKAIQIKGVVIKSGRDQAGNYTVSLKSDDPFSNVFCTLKKNENLSAEGATITLKGICSGYLTNVVLSDGVIVK